MHDWPMLLIYPIFQHIVVELVRREECNGGVHSVLSIINMFYTVSIWGFTPCLTSLSKRLMVIPLDWANTDRTVGGSYLWSPISTSY